MDQKRIKENIENGRYFVEARKWYNSVFLFPIRGNAFMLGSSISIILVLFFVFYGLYNIFPLSQQVKVVVFINDTITYSPYVRNISESGKSAQEAILEYLAEKYVKSREIYDPMKFKQNYNYILRSSDKKIFDEYYNRISNKDDNNPAVLYKNGDRDTFRTISKTYDAKNNFIVLKFAKENYNIISGKKAVQDFVANIGFYVSDYDFSESKNGRVNFIVTHYEVQEINA